MEDKRHRAEASVRRETRVQGRIGAVGTRGCDNYNLKTRSAAYAPFLSSTSNMGAYHPSLAVPLYGRLSESPLRPVLL